MSLWKEIEPFFLANGSWVTDEKYQEAADKTEAVCKDLGIPIKQYLTAVFYPRYSEQITAFKIRPRHLHSEWALRKLRDYVTLGDKVTPGKMEALFIQDTKKYIASLGISEFDYFTVGIIPKCLEDIRRRRISICYCCNSRVFRGMYKNLPKDVKDEYFDTIDVIDISTQIMINEPIMKAINS